MTLLSDLDLAAASPLLLPSLVRYRPLSSPPEEPSGGEVARVMAAFSDGEVPFVEGGNPGFSAAQGGLSPWISRLEARPVDGGGGSSTNSSSPRLVRKTISPEQLRVLLNQPERVLIASEFSGFFFFFFFFFLRERKRERKKNYLFLSLIHHHHLSISFSLSPPFVSFGKHLIPRLSSSS